MSQIKLVHSGGNGVIISAPSSNPASDVTFRLPNADGSANQFMKTDGSGNLAFAAATDTNDFVKLQAASSSTTISDLTFASLDVTTYRTFKIILYVLPATDNEVLALRFRNGSTDSTGNIYNYANIGVNGAGSYFDNGGQDTYAPIAFNAGNQNTEGFQVELTVVPRISSDPTGYSGNFGFSSVTRYSTSSSFRGENFWFHHGSTTNHDGFKIYGRSGDIAAYTYTLYGLKR